ncbi:hypothetical protein ScPMuIL_008690 [Solemya velum]
MAGSNLETQEAEITSLKEEFPEQCKVITGIGDFVHVVAIHQSGLNVVYKFQLSECYPDSPPNIIIRSPFLDKQLVGDLTTFLYNVAKDLQGSQMIKALMLSATHWIQEQGIDTTLMERHDLTTSKTEEGNMSKKGKKKQKFKKLREQVDKEGEDEKLPSMKTAGDVIKRIQWDSNLPQDELLVGYIDRFEGVMEKYFTAFSWEDIATVDYNVLAIPQHRIQYFKYKDIIVWDKNERIDHVFGSTGSKKTITDIISKYSEANLAKTEMAEQQQNEAICNDDDDDGDDDDDDDDDDSDSDDGITVNITSNSGYQGFVESDEETTGESNDYWQNKLRPNFFLAIRVLDKTVMKGIEDVQDFILKHEPRYSTCCIPPGASHITLCTLGLHTPEQKAHAMQALHRMQKEITGIIPKDAKLHIEGIDNFYSRVMYAKVNYPPQFIEFVDHIKLCLKEEGVEIRDNHDFVPHMTIMKVSRPVSREMGTKTISPFLSSGFSDIDFGFQSIDNIHLCEMVDARQEDGFYLTATSLEL